MGRSVFGHVGAAISAILAAASGVARPAYREPSASHHRSDTPDIVKRHFFRPVVTDRALAGMLVQPRRWSGEFHRSAGGQAHRRWRKRRASGRA